MKKITLAKACKAHYEKIMAKKKVGRKTLRKWDKISNFKDN